jgi:hypothetical protein
MIKQRLNRVILRADNASGRRLVNKKLKKVKRHYAHLRNLLWKNYTKSHGIQTVRAATQ